MKRLLPEEIHSSRLYLRVPKPADAEIIFTSYAQDPEVCRYMVWTPHTCLETTRTFIEGCLRAWQDNAGYFPYVVSLNGSAEPIGMLDARILADGMDIGYVLARPFWGQGYMPEAVRAIARTALAVPSLFRVQTTCDVENLASQRTLEKAGFEREARLERHTLHPNL
ncbi:MAG: GNAT family N-acetyltransferase, partial [Methylococcaceae bacterium]|nr:GNAT family N-acetyltransferase [Methylococcaceae bacterium]